MDEVGQQAGWYPVEGGQRWWDGRQWGVFARVRPSNGIAAWALVFGILAVLSTLVIPVAVFFAVIALVMGFVGLSLAKHGARGGLVALWAIILTVVPFGFAVFSLVAVLVRV